MNFDQHLSTDRPHNLRTPKCQEQRTFPLDIPRSLWILSSQQKNLRSNSHTRLRPIVSINLLRISQSNSKLKVPACFHIDRKHSLCSLYSMDPQCKFQLRTLRSLRNQCSRHTCLLRTFHTRLTSSSKRIPLHIFPCMRKC